MLARRFLLTLSVVVAFVAYASADKGRNAGATYSCTCMKKPTYKGKGECASGNATIKTKSANTTDKTMSGQCHNAFGPGKCSSTFCDATASLTADGPNPNDRPAKEKKAEEKTTGVADEHAEGLAKFAKDNGYTIIIRSTNTKSLAYQKEDQSKYRPKPKALDQLKTAKSGQNAGLIAKPNAKTLIEAGDVAKKEQAVVAEIGLLERECKNASAEDKKYEKCGWFVDGDGVLRDPKKRAVYGDYDVQGVYKGKQIQQTNDYEGKPSDLRKKMNEALDSSRTDPVQWLIQHGANDNYIDPKDKQKKRMGREPGLDEDFVIFEPDGNKKYVAKLSELREYYRTHEFPWNYETLRE